MRTIAIGDIHGMSDWQKIVYEKDYDKIIFVGDYWDSFDISFIEQLHNFRMICKFKEENPNNVILLIGNHDFHYTPVAGIYDEKYSGYQKKKAMEIGYELQRNMHLFQMAHLENGYLFTHAGVTKTWLNYAKRFCDFKTDEEIPIDEFLNDAFKHRPRLFCFNGSDLYGNDITQSPIWVRPDALRRDGIDYIHVVGHTQQRVIIEEGFKFYNDPGSVILIDTLGTSRQYLIIDDGKTEVRSLYSHRDGKKWPSMDFDNIE